MSILLIYIKCVFFTLFFSYHKSVETWYLPFWVFELLCCKISSTRSRSELIMLCQGWGTGGPPALSQGSGQAGECHTHDCHPPAGVRERAVTQVVTAVLMLAVTGGC